MSSSSPGFHESSLPLRYSSWINEIIRGDIPTEKLATCHDCAMCRKADEPEESQGLYFDPKVRCCSYVPELPNFLLGRILLEKNSKSVPGRDLLLNRITQRIALSPMGLGSGKMYSLLYSNSEHAFGSSYHLRCPYYIADGDLCGIWKHRNSVCSTWFCKHERGEEGYRFWAAVKQLLSTIENNLALACLMHLQLSNDSVFEILAQKQAEAEGGKANLLATSELDQVVDEKTYRILWGEWEGKEQEFFIRCAQFVDALSWKEVLGLCGPEVSLMIPLVKEAYLRLQKKPLPDVLLPGPIKVSQVNEENVLVETYSEYNPLSLPTFIFEILSAFDGSETNEVLARLAREKKVEVEEDFIRILCDYHVLVPA
ncbi:MAG TPA: hypothetical protein PKL85_11325 [Bacteroidia bacterium]|nr:hypothetical protein [Bacteroidia bacterium]